MQASPTTDTRLDTLKERIRNLLDTLPTDERIRIMESIQAFSEASDYMEDVFEAQLEAILKDHCIEF